jgi:MoxR-like ATPase
MTTEISQCWTDLDTALQAGIDRVLLYGQPGTGKTYYALNNHLETPTEDSDDLRTRRAYRVLCSPDMTTADIDGLWKPSKEDWKFVTGSALRAWEGGDRLILDELDQASGDVLTALLLICDSDGSAVREHPETGERISPRNGFEIIATTNAERLEDLPANLVDRFPVRININEVNPQALLGLPRWLQPIARSYANRTNDRYSLRSFFAFDKLSNKIGMETATRLVFGGEARAIMEAVRVATALGNEDATNPENVGIRFDLSSAHLEKGE